MNLEDLLNDVLSFDYKIVLKSVLFISSCSTDSRLKATNLE